MKPISIKPLTGSIVEAANNVSRDMGIVQPNGNAQDIGSGILPIHAGAGKVSQAGDETALKIAQEALEAAQAALKAAENALEAAESAQKDVTDLETDVNNKQDTLVSGVNIKTVNGIDVLGNGNIVINPTIMDLKWTTNIATTRKLVPAELRSKGVKIAYRDNNSVYHVEQYQVDAVDDASWENDANWKGCRTPLTPMFEAAGAVFNDETGYYELYKDEGGLTDITESQIYEIYRITGSLYADNNKRDYSLFAANIRTNFKGRVFGNLGTKFYLYGSSIEVFFASGATSTFSTSVVLLGLTAGDLYGCNKLRKIVGVISLRDINSPINGLFSIPNLEDVTIEQLHVNFSLFSNAPKISLDSWQYMVENASNTSAITVTVHPDVYAKLTDEANAEWYAVNTAAQAKLIAFATTETVQVATLVEGVEPQVETFNGELVCPIGYYITQTEDVTIENRLFLTRRIELNSEDVSKWRIATAEEKQEQDNYFANQLPTE